MERLKAVKRRRRSTLASLSLVLLSVLSGASCGRAPESTPVIEPGPSQEAIPTLTRATLGAGEKLRVVATTSIVGDVVHSVSVGIAS